LAEAKRNYGYFALLSNKIEDPLDALAIYRNEDLVEKAFENLKGTAEPPQGRPCPPSRVSRVAMTT